MYTFIIIVSLAFVIGFIYYMDGEWKWASSYFDAILNALGVAIVGAISSAIVIFIVSLAICSTNTTYTQKAGEPIKIHSMYNQGEISGYFFLFFGGLEEKDKAYYWKEVNGGYSKEEFNISNAVFYEEERSNGYLVTVYNVGTCNVHTEWLWMGLCNGESKSFDHIEVHIPIGSIYNGYELK